ncbi:hypothetical protein D5081_13475 [Pectobacterium carotovorum]|nr:hypothetical protein D5081_13475 [Pectobacterium carotovorum]RJL41497.1 hypothetical protein D5083_05765 [Pectobacterium carotovorum]
MKNTKPVTNEIFLINRFSNNSLTAINDASKNAAQITPFSHLPIAILPTQKSHSQSVILRFLSQTKVVSVTRDVALPIAAVSLPKIAPE